MSMKNSFPKEQHDKLVLQKTPNNTEISNNCSCSSILLGNCFTNPICFSIQIVLKYKWAESLELEWRELTLFT